MKTGRNRLWRQDHPRFGRVALQRRPRHVRGTGFALSIVALLALAAASAHGATGGASTVASSEAQAGSGVAFAPMRWAGATWYGPGLYGNHTACGRLLTVRTVGVAHRNLPCGTKVKFVYHGRSIVTQVIDRGPYTRGNAWDLTLAAAEALNFDEVGADRVGFAVALGSARKSPDAGAAPTDNRLSG
jgi:rare lipoprotein A (peptidoglycan hydrolase)